VKNSGDLTTLLRLMREARGYWPHLGGLLIVSLLAAPLALLVPVPLKIVVDSVLGSDPVPGPVGFVLPTWILESPERLLASAALLLVTITAAIRLQTLGHSWMNVFVGERLVIAFKNRLFRHAQRLSMLYHDSAGSSDAIYRIQYDAPAIQWVAIDAIIPFVSSAATVLGMVVVMVRIDWQLGLVAIAISPILMSVTGGFRPKLKRRWREVKQLESSSLAVLQEVMTSLRVVKAFRREEHEQQRLEERYEESFEARVRAMTTEGVLGVLVGLTTAVGTAAVLYIGARHVMTGVLTLGSLLLIMSYVGQLYAPLRTLGMKVASIQRSLASAERAFALLDREPDVVERVGARGLTRVEGHFVLQDVTFGYSPSSSVLNGINLVIEAGERIGIAGPTGTGKSTLAGLLARFFDPSKGAILVDGVDLRDIRVDDYRDQLSIVLQDTVLFSTSIYENIAYARPGAAPEEVEAAAKAADAHDFVSALDNGYQTIVGERGMTLSGGERQRIALARAFLKDSPILILDEPTSSVDLKTEASIMSAMEQLMEGRTVFMIAHRLSTLEVCDRVLVLKEGAIVADSRDTSEVKSSLLAGAQP